MSKMDSLPSDEEINLDDAFEDVLGGDAVDDLAVAAAWVHDEPAMSLSTNPSVPADVLSTNRDLEALRAEILLQTVEPVRHNLGGLVGSAVPMSESSSGSESDSDSEPGPVPEIGALEEEEEDHDDGAIPATKNEVLSVRQPAPKLDIVWVPAGQDVRVVGKILSVSYERFIQAEQSQRIPPDTHKGPPSGGETPGAAAMADDEVPPSSADKGASAAPSVPFRSLPVSVCTLVIQATAEGDPALDEGSLICLPDRRALGKVEEVFGPVKLPLYVVRATVVGPGCVSDAALAHWAAMDGFEGYSAAKGAAETHMPERSVGTSLVSADYSSDEEKGCAASGAPVPAPIERAAFPPERPPSLLRTEDLAVGGLVCFAPELARLVFPERIRAAFPRGTDASNLFDEEPGEDEEFSDDEAEAEARKARKAAAAARRPAASPPAADLVAAGVASGDGSALLARGGGRGGGRGARGGRGERRGGRGGGAVSGQAGAPPQGFLGYPSPQPMPPLPLQPPMFLMGGGAGFPPPGQVWGGAGAVPQPPTLQQMQHMHMQWQLMMQAQMMAMQQQRR